VKWIYYFVFPLWERFFIVGTNPDELQDEIIDKVESIN